MKAVTFLIILADCSASFMNQAPSPGHISTWFKTAMLFQSKPLLSFSDLVQIFTQGLYIGPTPYPPPPPKTIFSPPPPPKDMPKLALTNFFKLYFAPFACN